MALSRITDSMMNYGFLSGMNKSLNAQYKLQEQLTDGLAIHRPSDNPVKVVRSLQYSSALIQNEQYSNNVKDATSWLQTTDTAVTSLSQLMSQAKSIIVQAIAPSPAIAYDAAAKELDGLINEAVSIGNTKIGARYIFGGQMDSTQPFERVTLADPTGKSNLTVDTVVYNGDDRKISMMTQAGAINVARDGVNLTGVDVFGRTAATGTSYGQATLDVFNSLIRIKEELEKTAIAKKTNSLGGELDVDGGYTGSNTYQDFAVKIDALKVKAKTYLQGNAAGGSLALSYTETASTMPTYAAGLQMQIVALKVTPTVTPPVGHETGALTMESTSNVMPALTTPNELKVKVHATQVEVGSVIQSNVIGGALNVTYNGYGDGTPATAMIPANLMVRIAAGGVGALGVVSAAEYSVDNGGSWLAATGAAGSFTLDNATANTGLTITMATNTNNAALNTYTVPLTSTGKVMKMDYTVDNWANTNVAAPDAATDPIKFTLPSAVTGFTGNTYVQLGSAATNVIGDVHTVTKMSTSGEVSQASYNIGAGFVAATVDTASPAGSFNLDAIFFKVHIGTNSTNDGTDTYTLSTLSTDTSAEVASVSYSLDHGNTWTKATGMDITKSNILTGDLTLGGQYTGLPAYEYVKATVQAWNASPAITQSNSGSGLMKLASDGATTNPIPIGFKTRIDTVDSSGKVTALSYYDTGTAAWISGTPETSQGPTVFQLGASGLYASVADSTNNVAADTYTTTSLGTADATNPALISYVVAPAPDTAGSTPAYSTTPVYSMKDANPNVSGFALPDGVTADIAANSANNVTDNYTFRIPPRFTLRDGVEVSIAPDANNIVKDAYTFTMPPNTLHTAADLTAGPDLDWLSDKGLANLSTAHDQILSALVTVGTKESSNDMTANLLDTSSTNLNAVLATNDDIDMSKAIIDMKTAENVYQAALSFGARVMPTSLVDFLK